SELYTLSLHDALPIFMELIVLNIGLDLGVISPTLFAMMVLMALVTTVATTPLLQFLERPKTGNGEIRNPNLEIRNKFEIPNSKRSEEHTSELQSPCNL